MFNIVIIFVLILICVIEFSAIIHLQHDNGRMNQKLMDSWNKEKNLEKKLLDSKVKGDDFDGRK